MKIIKTASGKRTIKISKKEWEYIGKTAGWMKKRAGRWSEELTDDYENWTFSEKYNFLMFALRNGLSNFRPESDEYYNLSGHSMKKKPPEEERVRRQNELVAIIEPKFDFWINLIAKAQKSLKEKCPEIASIRWRGTSTEVTTRDGGLYELEEVPFVSKDENAINEAIGNIANKINNATEEEKKSAQWGGANSRGMAAYYESKGPGDYTGD